MGTPKIFRPRINPAFHQYPGEAAIIGRLVVAFGELEYLTAVCAGRAINQRESGLKALYCIRATSSRIEAADALMRPIFERSSLEPDYNIMMDAIKHCMKIRNQYAHCNWADAEDHGLFFVDLQETAKVPTGFELRWRHVDVPLLEEQEAFFVFAQTYLYFFEYHLSVIQGMEIYPHSPKPLLQAPPPQHNPPEKHVPPWLDEEQRALHLARARAAQGGPPTPSRGQQALDKAREEKRLKRAEQIHNSREGERRAQQRDDSK